MKLFVTRILFLTSLFFVVGCQTTPLAQYKQVRVGMEKFEVLELMGSPQRNIRASGVDKWTYIFYDQSHRYQREVHFKNDRAIYVGEPVKPKVTAEQTDSMNDRVNKNIEQQNERQRLEVVPGQKSPASENGSSPIKVPVEEILNTPESSKGPKPIYTEIK
ncbi:MAG: hypothetical protein BroJett040_18460 [Oligoflexia bacterium]|nr:MAG: hypothetical protein BroJett040_18460 [Oligoflexia bacterium]